MFLALLLIFLSPQLSLSLTQDGLFLYEAKLSLSDPTNALANWNPRDPTPCNWTGIRCNNSSLSSPRVVNVSLSSLYLSGPFPSSLCRISSLSFLSLDDNNLNSTLTFDPSTCHNLNFVNLSQNLFTGALPENLAFFPNLKLADLSYNNFSGDVPASYGLFQRLETLILIDNLLNGHFPEVLANVSSLKDLQLAYNPLLTGPIPIQLANMTSLENLWLTQCNLVGEIPSQLSELPRLTNLDLSFNGLTGSIPSELTRLTTLVQLELYNNSLVGELPTGMSNMTRLLRFDVSNNKLGGLIPTDLTQLQLESLNLFSNEFVGPIPENIAASANLVELKLFNNKLTGKLPANLGLNSKLQRVDVSENSFSGKIPETLCANWFLEELILIDNSFSGKIPESLGNCSSLIRVRLKGNKLSGEVPAQFWGLPNVDLFELSNNNFTGGIARDLSQAQSLSVLRVSGNQLDGEIPAEIGMLQNLVEFSASGNLISGQIPDSIVNLSQLGGLDLSENSLSGGIPNGIHLLKNLNELNLANNELSGEIPAEIGSLPVLNYLDLSGNQFVGEIPIALQNLKLNKLNLSDNRLSGKLPPMFDKEMYRASFLGNPGLCHDNPILCSDGSGVKKTSIFWIIPIFLLAGLVLVVGVGLFYWKFKDFIKARKGNALSKWRSFHKLGFRVNEILDCLDENNVIGSGASGKVYKVVLSKGETVAVKKLWEGVRKEETSMDSNRQNEFEVEVETLGKIRHKNIVRLWCCCSTNDCKLLVYEYMPNGSLGDLLHGSKCSLLDWPARYKIAVDAAEGLCYLHHDCAPPIVHRDMKSNNILLDAEFGARIADFGLAKVFKEAEKQTAESMSVIAGSCGYIAPEYAYTLRVNEKSDIYSFGVVLLELVTGRRPIDQENGEKDLVTWASTTLDQKGLGDVLDPKLDSLFKEQMSKVLDIAIQCVNPLPINRPSMRKVVKLLRDAGAEKRPKVENKDGKLSPYYYDDNCDQNNMV